MSATKRRNRHRRKLIRSAKHRATVERMVVRDYALCPGDVALDGCYGGPDDDVRRRPQIYSVGYTRYTGAKYGMAGGGRWHQVAAGEPLDVGLAAYKPAGQDVPSVS